MAEYIGDIFETGFGITVILFHCILHKNVMSMKITTRGKKNTEDETSSNSEKIPLAIPLIIYKRGLGASLPTPLNIFSNMRNEY